MKVTAPLAAWCGALGTSVIAAAVQPWTVAVKMNPLRDAYYGDLHLHTSYSFDAYFAAGTKVDPDQAYRFARGEEIDYLGERVKRREPLDFLAITDHAENIGVFNQLDDPNSTVSRSNTGAAVKSILSARRATGQQDDPNTQKAKSQYSKFLRDYFLGSTNQAPDNLKAESMSAWQRAMDSANRHNDPGRFTTFIAYEWTSTPYGSNLHRNVIFKGKRAPYPFTALDSKKPEDLWAWLEAIHKQGYEALAIPHNGNMSNGLMYDWIDSDGIPIDRTYALRRQTHEPLSEIAQAKGTSETHPLLSPNDEFANFEIVDRVLGSAQNPSRPQGSYLRDALSRGLAVQRQVGVNPFRYGFIGASDLHTGLSVSAEADYSDPGRLNTLSGRPDKARAETLLNTEALAILTSGSLTGVWAESNTRESIYNALRRRETFAASGTKLKVRFFGGWRLGKGLLQRKDCIPAAYAAGVPMGSDLPPKPDDITAPTFAIWAIKDPSGAHLDRAQIVKVWEEHGRQKEKVFDVAWSGDRKADLKTGKLPPVGNTLDLKTVRHTHDTGAVELKAIWTDPQFDPHRLAAYYLRVLEIPAARWSTLLADRNGLPLPKDVPPTIQERAWSSPIWYTPQH